MDWVTEHLEEVYEEWVSRERPSLEVELDVLRGLEVVRADPPGAAHETLPTEFPDVTVCSCPVVAAEDVWLAYVVDATQRLLSALHLGDPNSAVR
jgi:hypothetical protein